MPDTVAMIPVPLQTDCKKRISILDIALKLGKMIQTELFRYEGRYTLVAKMFHNI